MAHEDAQTRVMTRKERERAARREEIIDAAEALFAAQGFENTTMDEIAERAEFGKPTLYSYFKSKDEILFLVHMRKHEPKMAVLRGAIAEHTTGIDKLQALGLAYYEFYRQNPEYLRMQVYWDYKGFDFDKFGTAVRKQYQELESAFYDFCEILRIGVEDGTIRDNLDVEQTLDLFFMLMRTVLNQVMLVTPPAVSQLNDNSEKAYFSCLDLFLESVRAGT
jgi:TetR/AcrR family transcriptional regulator